MTPQMTNRVRKIIAALAVSGGTLFVVPSNGCADLLNTIDLIIDPPQPPVVLTEEQLKEMGVYPYDGSCWWATCNE